MEIGRKIYFELNTGNVIMIRESRTGYVNETTKEQDFANYTALQPYQLSAVGEIQVQYGSQSEVNLSKYPCRIDISKNPIDETAIIFDTDNPLGATLAEVQSLKLVQIKDLYNQKLESGFTSSATGTPYLFGYGQSDRDKFMQLAISVLSGIAQFPVTIHAKTGEDVPHTQTQYNQLIIDIGVFAQMQDTKEHNFINQVNACTTVDQVNAIVVSF